MNQPYSQLAQWYDQLYDDNFYHQYSELIKHIVKQRKIRKIRLLDIACGTGRLLAELTPGATFTAGLDMSAEMLIQAQKRLPNSKLYNQDLQAIEVDETYNLITCTFDSINYVLDIKGVINVFQSVNKYLETGGVFIFDFNTIHKQASGKVSRGEVTYQDRINSSFWEISIETPDGEEQHRERLYTLKEIKSALEKSNMHIESMYSDFKTKAEKENKHQRLIVIATKNTTKHK